MFHWLLRYFSSILKKIKILVSLEFDNRNKIFYRGRETFYAFFTTFLGIQEHNTCFYGCLNLSLYIFIRKIISMAFRFLLIFHCTYNGVSLFSFWLNRYSCRQAFWDLLRVIWGFYLEISLFTISQDSAYPSGCHKIKIWEYFQCDNCPRLAVFISRIICS